MPLRWGLGQAIREQSQFKATTTTSKQQQLKVFEAQYVHPPQLGSSMRLANSPAQNRRKHPHSHAHAHLQSHSVNTTMASTASGPGAFDVSERSARSEESEAALHSFFDMSWTNGGIRESANRFERRRRDCSFHMEPEKPWTESDRASMESAFKERLRLQTESHAARKKSVDRRKADEQRAKLLRVKKGEVPKRRCKEKLNWRMKY